MDSRSFPVVTIIFFFTVFGEIDNAESSKPLYISSGHNVTLNPHMSGTPTDILWKHNENKLVEWDPAYKEYNKFSGKVSLNTTTGEITIRGLSTDLSGLYTIEYTTDKLHHYSQRVEVIDPVTKPEITCDRTNDTSTTLRCSALGSKLQYRWSGPGLSKDQEESKVLTTTEEGLYTCEVKNPVGQQQHSFNTTECGNHPPNTNKQTNVGAVVGPILAIAVILAIVIGVVIWFKRFKNKKSSSGTDRISPETRLEDQSSSLDQRRVNPHHNSEIVPLLDKHEGNGTLSDVHLERETRDDRSTGDTSLPEGTKDVPQGSPVSPGSAPPPKPPRLSQHVSNKDPPSENTEVGEEREGRGEQTDEGRDDCREEEGSTRAVDARGEAAEQEGMTSEEDAREARVASGGGEGAARVEGSERQKGTEDAPGTLAPCPGTAAGSEEQIREDDGTGEGRGEEDRDEEEGKKEGREEGDRLEEGREEEVLSLLPNSALPGSAGSTNTTPPVRGSLL